MGDDCLVLPNEPSLCYLGHHMSHAAKQRTLFSAVKSREGPHASLWNGVLMTVGVCSPSAPCTVRLVAAFSSCGSGFDGRFRVSLFFGWNFRGGHTWGGNGHGAQVWLVSKRLLPSYLAMGTGDSPPCTLSLDRHLLQVSGPSGEGAEDTLWELHRSTICNRSLHGFS